MERAISPPETQRSKRKRSNVHTENRPHHGTKCPERIRILSWNVNGIHPFLQSSLSSYFQPKDVSKSSPVNGTASLRGCLRRHGWPTLFFLQEVNINPDDSATQRAVELAVRRQAGEPDDAHDYEVHFYLPSDQYNARGFGRKIYGVCSIVRKDFSERYVNKIRPVEWDKEGRFIVIETNAIDDIPKLAIINVYMVNGTDNLYKDPDNGQTAGTRHDRKLAVHSLLQVECRKLEENGFSVIIAGDINIARSRIDGHPNLRTVPNQHCHSRADFEAKFFSVTAEKKGQQPGLGMMDSFRYLYPDKKAYTFYPRTKGFGESCDRVDMILLSKSLESNLQDAGMHETVAERGPSDHVPLWADLEFGESRSEVL